MNEKSFFFAENFWEKLKEKYFFLQIFFINIVLIIPKIMSDFFLISQ